MRLEEVWRQLNPEDRTVLLAALWAGRDVHAPLDNLTDDQYARLDDLADFVNEAEAPLVAATVQDGTQQH